MAITRNVNDIAADERRALEGMLGVPLDGDQHVFILAYTPGSVPDETARHEARLRLEQTLAKNQAFATEHGIAAADADDAVAEAMQQIRRRS